jgi:signal transduction histidine kinase
MEVKAVEIHFQDLIEGLLPSFRLPAEKKKIDLHFDYDPGLIGIKQDPGKIRQILTNLLSNAIKFTPENGIISLKATSEGEFLVLTVTDTGVGIPLADQDAIFEKFRQSGEKMTREHEGSGLGLSIVRELCVLLGGEVTLKSDLGRGSAFTVKIPKVYAPKPKQEFQRQAIDLLGLPDGRKSGELSRPVLGDLPTVPNEIADSGDQIPALNPTKEE